MLGDVTTVDPVTVLRSREKPIAGVIESNPNILLADIHCWKMEGLQKFCLYGLEMCHG